jgi:hypothetical protein
MNLTHFERLAITTAIGLSTGTAADIRQGFKILDRVDFSDAYKAGKPTDANGLLLDLPPADLDTETEIEISEQEQKFISGKLKNIAGLPMNRRSLALLDKFGV